MSLEANPIVNRSIPYQVREGLYEAVVPIQGEDLYFRMQVVTEPSCYCWDWYKYMTQQQVGLRNGMTLNKLIKLAGSDDPSLDYESIKDKIGMTKPEFDAFMEKAIERKNSQKKLVNLICSILLGNIMDTYYTKKPKNETYIVYVTRNREFDIETADPEMKKSMNVKEYIEAYKDLLITVGSNFSNGSEDYPRREPHTFQNRGIARNPYWVFEGKYAGLSMLLHGFTGMVASQFFPEKTEMCVKPLRSMQAILKKNLLPGEGYVVREEGKVDLSQADINVQHFEGLEDGVDYIQVSALQRIYQSRVA